MRWPSTACRPKRASTLETSSTETTHVSHPPPSAARFDTALPKGEASDAG